jgi:hypothetical protein
MQTRLIITLAALVATTVGCGSNGLSSSQQDFNSYIEEANALGGTEQTLLTGLDAVLGDNYVDDATVYVAYSQLLPEISSLIVTLQSIEAPGRLAPIHSKWVAGWQSLYTYAAQMVGAIETNDAGQLASILSLQTQGIQLLTEYRSDLAQHRQQIK